MASSLSAKSPFRALAGLIPVLFGVVLLSGCDTDGYPQQLVYPPRTDPIVVGKAEQDAPHIDLPGEFPLLFVGLPEGQRDKLLLDPAQKVNADLRRQLEATLNDLFGTPRQPKVDGIDSEVRDLLRLDEATLAAGSVEYRHQCLHCHGLSGGGRGPTAPWVNPHPRDYRPGRFKFTSSKQDEGVRKPRREDLLRTLRDGIDGSSMPSFRLLTDPQLDALTSYVIHLSLRGETEIQMLTDLASGDLSDASQDTVLNYLNVFAGRWQEAQTSAILPGPYSFTNEAQLKESAQRGMELFTKPGEAGCIACHTDFGRQAPWKFDAWGTMVRPTNLTLGVYRGGGRPVDLYYRIDAGINGAGMTAFGKNLKPEQMWDLVNFLRVLPYPKMRQEYGINID